MPGVMLETWLERLIPTHNFHGFFCFIFSTYQFRRKRRTQTCSAVIRHSLRKEQRFGWSWAGQHPLFSIRDVASSSWSKCEWTSASHPPHSTPTQNEEKKRKPQIPDTSNDMKNNVFFMLCLIEKRKTKHLQNYASKSVHQYKSHRKPKTYGRNSCTRST